jgi:glycosyltransferase involved in cell wall biosynthesis
MITIDQQPLVSIITPVYNGAQYLEELIQSVLQQDYPNIEHIIIDDGSTDNGETIAILKRYPHLRWWSRENKGQYQTLNEGIVAARGAILGIISADDMYIAPHAISAVISYWHVHPEFGCVYGRVLKVDKNGHPLPFVNYVEVNGPFPLWLLRYKSWIYHCSLFVAGEIVIGNEIWFDPALRYLGDWDWIIRLLKAGCRFGFLDQILAMYRVYPGQFSSTTGVDLWLAETRAVCRRNGVNYRLCLLLKRVLNARHRALSVLYKCRMGGTKSPFGNSCVVE